jgi:hypothetical protein
MMLVGSHSPGELFVVIVVVALIPAVVEELMFRGLVQQSFERSLTPSRGVVVTGVVFAAYHLNPFAFIPLCALGIYLGFLAMRAGSIWVSATAHFVNNAAASVAVYLHFDDNAIVNGNPETMPPQVLLPTVFVFAVIFVASTYMFIHVTRHRQAAGAEDGAPA